MWQRAAEGVSKAWQLASNPDYYFRWTVLIKSIPFGAARAFCIGLLLVHGATLAQAMAPAPSAVPPRAVPCIEPAADSSNTYDAAHTYDKLVKGYPFIHIASAELPSGVTKVADQTFAQYGTRCLKLDLYLPAAPAIGPGRPVVVFVHGGGWSSGFRSEFSPMAVRLAQRGYASALISYRLSGEAIYPAAIHDARAAVRWVRLHAGQYRLDPLRIALAGGSAGGQIASLAGVTGGSNRFDAGAAGNAVSSAVRAIVSIDGLSDFTSEAARANENPAKKATPAALWLGGRYAEKTEVWREASPIQYVRADMPPILFLDSSIPRFSAGRDEMVAKMNAVGAISQVVFIPETPHSFWLFDPWLQPSVNAIAGFLDAQMPAN
jgi:acetyl esterase/lipase